MRTKETELVRFRVQQAIGSMAIEGIRVSRRSEADMLRIASGRVSVESVIKRLVEEYRQHPTR